jgi:hypothetical protein
MIIGEQTPPRLKPVFVMPTVVATREGVLSMAVTQNELCVIAPKPAVKVNAAMAQSGLPTVAPK